VSDDTSGGVGVAASPAPPHVSYAQGMFRFIGLEGSDCRLYNLAGRLLQTFRITASDERRSITLPPGIYILATQKQSFKIVNNE
jgi:hypothetical protein